MISKKVTIRALLSKLILFHSNDKSDTEHTATIKPKGQYLVAYHKGDYFSISFTYDRLKTYCEEKHLTMHDYAYEEYLISEVATKNEKEYVTCITIGVNADYNGS